MGVGWGVTHGACEQPGDGCNPAGLAEPQGVRVVASDEVGIAVPAGVWLQVLCRLTVGEVVLDRVGDGLRRQREESSQLGQGRGAGNPSEHWLYSTVTHQPVMEPPLMDVLEQLTTLPCTLPPDFTVAKK